MKADKDERLIRSFDVQAKGMDRKTVRFILITPENTIWATKCYSLIVREFSL